MVSLGSRWSDLPQRMTVICVGFPLLWMVWSNDHLRQFFFQGLHVVLCVEWTRMTRLPQHVQWMLPLVSIALSNISNDRVFLASSVLSIAMANLAYDGRTSGAVMTAFFLITCSCRAWLEVARKFETTVSLLLTVWNCDTGALVAGRFFKGTLALKPNWLHRISPNKSLEGLLGGMLVGTLTYVGLPRFWSFIDFCKLPPSPTAYDSLDLFQSDWHTGIILSLCAVVGDLWESTIKRQYAVKDSSKMLPGHGGILDRFDSSFLAVLLCTMLN